MLPLWVSGFYVYDYLALKSPNLFASTLHRFWKKIHPRLFPGTSPVASIFWHPDFVMALKSFDTKGWIANGMSQSQELGGPAQKFNVEYLRGKMEQISCSEYSVRQVISFIKKLSCTEVLFRPLTESEGLLSM